MAMAMAVAVEDEAEVMAAGDVEAVMPGAVGIAVHAEGAMPDAVAVVMIRQR